MPGNMNNYGLFRGKQVRNDYRIKEMKYKGEKFLGPDRMSPYPVSRLGGPVDLVETATRIAAADDMLSVQAAGKLKLLAEQIEELQDKARKILQETTRNQELHRAQCGFKKIAGNVYHLYRKDDDSLIFSMIGQDEWKRAGSKNCPFEYVGTYRLESDSSWTPVEVEK